MFRYVLFSILLLSFSRCSYFWFISFFTKINNRWAWEGPDRTDAVGNRNAELDGEAHWVRVMLVFVLYSIHFFFLLFFLSNCLQYDM